MSAVDPTAPALDVDEIRSRLNSGIRSRDAVAMYTRDVPALLGALVAARAEVERLTERSDGPGGLVANIEGLGRHVEELLVRTVTAKAESDTARTSVAALREAMERLASGPDHHLVLSAEPERTEVRMDGSSPYGLRYTGEIGAFAMIMLTPGAADRLRAALVARPHLSAARLRAAAAASSATEPGR